MKNEIKKNLIKIVLIFIVFMVIFNLFQKDSGIIAIIKLNKKKHELVRNINDSISVLDSLEREVERLQKDTLYLERIAREKYGMSRGNEKIYKFVEEKRK